MLEQCKHTFVGQFTAICQNVESNRLLAQQSFETFISNMYKFQFPHIKPTNPKMDLAFL